MPTIELGDVTGSRHHGPAADRLHLRPHHLPLAVVVLALLACGGAAPAAAPGVRRLWDGAFAPDSILTTSGQGVYVQSDGALTAYDLADGDVRWTWRTTAGMLGSRASPGGGPVLVSIDDASLSHLTIALDAESGAELWRRPGQVRFGMIDATSALLIGYDEAGDADLSRVRLADGEPLWTRPARGLSELATDGADRLAVKTRSGHVTVLRYADAAALAHGRITGVDDPLSGQYVSMSMDGGRLLLFHSEGDRSYTTVHDMATLREVRRSDSAEGPVSGCGVVLCRFERDRFVALDPVTGTELWDETSVAGLSLVAGDRLLLDLTDGRENLLVAGRTGDHLVAGLTGTAILEPAEESSFLLLRRTAAPAGRTAITRIDLRTGRGDLLGAVPAVPDPQSCQTAPGYLVCPEADRFVVSGVRR